MPISFQLLANHPALDFVNTLDNRFGAAKPTELLTSYPELVAFAVQSRLVDARIGDSLCKGGSASQERTALLTARRLRECLANLFYEIVRDGTPVTASLNALQEFLRQSPPERTLTWKAADDDSGMGARAAWAWTLSQGDLALPVWAIADSGVALLTSPTVTRVHECQSPSCRWLFLDTSKNHSRRWCDMTLCGNRSKVRRFQEKHRRG